MKKGLFLVVLMVATFAVWAQVPQTLTYQAVVRDGNGRLVCNSNVGVRISILQGSESGVAVYSDQQTVRTNANGLFTLLIGTAENSIGGINWAAGPYYLKSEIDHTSGSNYTLATVQQMFSVPYALRAHTVDSIIGGVNYNETDPVFSAWDKDYNDLINKPTIPTAVSELANDAGYITSSDAQTVIENITSNAGYLSSYTETQTLSDVAALGNSANAQLKDVSDPTDAMDAVNLRTLNLMVAEYTHIIDSVTHRFDSIIAYQASVIDTLSHQLDDFAGIVPQSVGGFDENGASNALFSVAEGRQVRFSKGNLQYTTVGTHTTADGGTAVGTWRFAEHQWDTIGEDNYNISSTYDGWIDLFGFGTSGWNSGANAYQPWSSSTDNADYCPNSLTEEYANADWGIYNAISNGGNLPGMWRTITSEEFSYILSSRTKAAKKRGLAIVNGIKGLVLLPDEWRLPIGLTFSPGYEDKWTTNEYTEQEWREMESAGAIFLPAENGRRGHSEYPYYSYSLSGAYWTSSTGSCLRFAGASNSSSASPFINTYNNTNNSMGYSIRLVKDFSD